jgi:CRISPR-associated protein Csm1
MNHDELLQTTTRIALTCLLKDVSQFAESATIKLDDFLSKAASNHQIPDDYLQAIIKAADLVASGFDPETANSEKLSKAETNQQVTLFEQIYDAGKKSEFNQFSYHYPPKPLSPSSIFPVSAASHKTQPGEYKKLCQDFVAAIPEQHRDSLPLWLDHFDSCWQTYAHNIPSKTALGVSLYDHSKTVAALAVALWLYHKDKDDDKSLNLRNDWHTPKLLLVQGDFFGIQAFIFAKGGDSTKKAAKLLRGRSFYVSLISECAALLVLEALHLPATSQIINAAGKFLIVAPNTQETINQLQALQQQFNNWFLEYSYGQSGLGLAWEEARCEDFVSTKEKPAFKALKTRLDKSLEKSRYQHFDLCGDKPAEAVFAHYLDSFNNDLGVCQLNDKAPAVNKVGFSRLAQDQINIGTWLIKQQRLFIANKPISGLEKHCLEIALFDKYYIHFVAEEDLKGNFGKEVREGIIRRAFDFSRPESDTKTLWNGYARRNISGYVPYFEEAKLSQEEKDKYEKFLKNDKDIGKLEEGEPKTLNHLALDSLNWKKDENQQSGWYGIQALAVLKGDIDNLGTLFQNGLENPTFAKTAALSRQVHNFFALYLPYLCETKYPNTYIVFAGGDDFFLLGSWKKLMELANQLHSEFNRYVADNAQIHFSAGLTVTKPKIPIHQLAALGEKALEQAKHYPGKNAVTCFGETVSWNDFSILTNQRYQHLDDLRHDFVLSTGYIYSLLRLVDMAANPDKPENSLWRSQLYYRTYRTVASQRDLSKEQKKSRAVQLVHDIGEKGIKEFTNGYRITLQAHLYHYRKQS